jgi:phosphoribosylformylglycinamidine synthase
LDPYKGGQASVDEACRNIVAVGGTPHSLTNCLNFGNPEKPERLGELKEAIAGLASIAIELGLAVPSGNVSLYNETSKGPCLPTATVLGLGIVEDVRNVVTTDLKHEGNPIFLVGETKEEMGGSALYRRFGGKGGLVPDVDSRRLKSSIQLMNECMKDGMVRSCHDLSDGGLAVSIAEMCIAGDVGAEIDVGAMGEMTDQVRLFSESNTRWIVEIDRGREKEFVDHMSIPIVRLGHVGGSELIIKGNGVLISQSVEALRECWSQPLWKLLG